MHVAYDLDSVHDPHAQLLVTLIFYIGAPVDAR